MNYGISRVVKKLLTTRGRGTCIESLASIGQIGIEYREVLISQKSTFPIPWKNGDQNSLQNERNGGRTWPLPSRGDS